MKNEREGVRRNLVLIRISLETISKAIKTLITLVNIVFVTWKLICVAYVFFHAEFK